MSAVVTHLPDRSHTVAQARNRRIGGWLTKLASYVQHSREFRDKPEKERAEFWAELVLVMAEAELPDTVWNADAVRFCRRRFKFFPCAAELCAALNEYAEPLRAAAREQWQRERISRHSSSDSSQELTPKDRVFLAGWHEANTDGFRQLAFGRGTTPDEARRSSLSLLKQQAPRAYQQLVEDQKYHA